MLFWGIAGLLTLICVILVIWPLLRQKEVLENNVDHNLKVYKDQLSEVDKDFQLGRVDSKELDAIKTEIQRRILTENVEANQQKQSKQLTPTTYVIFTLVASFLIPSVAIGMSLYQKEQTCQLRRQSKKSPPRKKNRTSNTPE